MQIFFDMVLSTSCSQLCLYSSMLNATCGMHVIPKCDTHVKPAYSTLQLKENLFVLDV